MGGMGIEERTRMCVYRCGVADSIIGYVCVKRDEPTLPSQRRTKTCSWCKGIQGVEDTRRCI